MTRKFNFLDKVFLLLSGLILLMVLLPLVSVLLGLSPQQLSAALTDSEVLDAIGLTFSAAAIATGLALIGGVPLAYLLARRDFWGKSLVEAVINLPVVVPHTAAGIALLLVFGRQGLIGKFLYPLGLTFTDNLGGIVIAMLFVSLPFLINASREAFALVDKELELAAFSDGASPWQAFWYVTLPLVWRGIASGAMMMWARGISEFGAVVILAYHPKTAPVLIFQRFEGFGLKAAQPVAALLILTVLFVFVILHWVSKAKDQQVS
ncbi:MAG: ABC transporter permease [Chloroflexi bacterium]|nr:ABC transporter permease [Chloroflexota bacterium]